MLRNRLVSSRIAPAIGRLGRLLGAGRSEAPVPEEVISYQGRIYVEPSDDYSDGHVMLIGTGSLADYICEQAEVPLEFDGTRMAANLYVRITVEVLPDPDMNGWPYNPNHTR